MNCKHDFRAMLREMAQSWRDKTFGGQHCSELRSNILEECADELTAALDAPTAPRSELTDEERERDAALEREVKALQMLNIAGERLKQLEVDRVAALARVKELEALVKAHETACPYEQRALTAESALTSVRDAVRECWNHIDAKTRERLSEALSAAPSPAPCTGCPAARELLENAYPEGAIEEWWARRDAWLKQNKPHHEGRKYLGNGQYEED